MSLWTRANIGDEIHVTAPDDLAATRLRKPTRFVRARQVRVGDLLDDLVRLDRERTPPQGPSAAAPAA